MVGSKSSEDQEEASDPTRMNLPPPESKYIQMPKVVALNSLESKSSFTGEFFPHLSSFFIVLSYSPYFLSFLIFSPLVLSLYSTYCTPYSLLNIQ